jgi:hypothetical protein
MIKSGNYRSTSVDISFLKGLTLGRVYNMLSVDKKVSECHTVAM